MTSLRNDERHDEFNGNRRSNFRHPHRRYILEIPDSSTRIKTSINDEQQTKLNSNNLRRQIKPSNASKNENKFLSHQNINHSKYNTNNEQYLKYDLNKNLYTNHQHEINLSKHDNENIDDSWVKQILQTDFDLSTLDQQDPRVQILNIDDYRTNNSNSASQYYSHDQNNNQDDFETKLLDPYQYPVTVKDKNRKANPNSSQLNHSSRKWILQPPTYSPINSNSFSSNKNIHSQYKDKFNTRQLSSQKTNIDEEENLFQQENNSIYSKHQKRNKQYEKENTTNEKSEIKTLWNLFSSKEKRNIFIYIFGIMLYKFGLEAFNGSIVSLATNRYDRDAFNSANVARTFEKVGLLVGLNQACQCIGSILIAPLIKRWPTRTVLSISIFAFALFTALLMIIDAATGGKIKPSNFQAMHENDYSYYGNYPTYVIIPIYCVTGIAYGMVELIRRIIPRDIVGSDEEKLQRMDALVHVFYEIAGVSGALTTGLVLIPRLGNNYSFLITPILFSFSAVVWILINSLGTKTMIEDEQFSVANQNHKTNYFKALIKGFVLFGESVYIGGKIIFTNRKYFWLFPCYSLTLYIHRYIENGIAPQVAKRYLQNSEWSQIIVGGSNFGELIGALFVFFLTKKIRSPLVWLRLDSILLFIVWYLPFYNPSSITVKNAWIIALSFIPFGFGSAGDDVSLNAHIQSSLSQPQLKNKDVSSLGAVMAFLYSSYIILYAILNPLLGKYIDSVYNSKQTIRPALIFTVGVQTTIISIIVFLSTFIPKGSFKLNPSLE
ncbi:unnamed protein product [Rotaria sp. Silwood1]|nr:unnamed protein product [Rotaria sp. Silwood1]CAF3652158.1 unnamed protein product [Rotaria sp. Silwood1]CAF4727619.1 unnamed protein product [Rotaria sp. Silwood1]CAF4751336.1 unnamed protein product [Rotaria sp. Silwood1]